MRVAPSVCRVAILFLLLVGSFGLVLVGPSCSIDDDCPQNEFCEYALGDCDGLSGFCTVIPSTCEEDSSPDAPVCGCNGVMYPNPCEAQAALESLLSEEPCIGYTATTGTATYVNYYDGNGGKSSGNNEDPKNAFSNFKLTFIVFPGGGE